MDILHPSCHTVFHHHQSLTEHTFLLIAFYQSTKGDVFLIKKLHFLIPVTSVSILCINLKFNNVFSPCTNKGRNLHSCLWLTTGMEGKPCGLNSDVQIITNNRHSTLSFDWEAEAEIQVAQQSLFSFRTENTKHWGDGQGRYVP